MRLVLAAGKYILLLCAAAFAGIFAAIVLSPGLRHLDPVSSAHVQGSLASMYSPLLRPVTAAVVENTPSGPYLEKLAVSDETVLLLAEEDEMEVITPTREFPFPTTGAFAPVNESARNALVNIYCTRKDNDRLITTVGSGVIISPHGVVLTNAHVAALFLLEGTTVAGTTRCLLRNDSPARDAYEAELLYLPERWIRDFAPPLDAEEARGTGEEDFALLLITDTTDADKDLPKTFSYAAPNLSERAVSVDDQLLVAGYPALAGTLSSIHKRLYLVSALTAVKKLYTFDRTGLDLFSLHGTIVSEHGTSGGAVANQAGEVVGIVVTSTMAPLTLERELRVLSLAHINRRLVAETGKNLTEISTGNVRDAMRTFQEQELPVLASLILSPLPQQN